MAQEIKRIEKEFIFKTLADKNAPISVHLGSKRYSGRLQGFSGQRVSISVDSAFPRKAPESVTIYFSFRGTSMTATCSVFNLNPEGLVINLPEKVFRDLSRSFERVQPEGEIGVSLLLDGVTYKLDLPSSESFYDPTSVPALDNKFDPTRIAQLLQGFREKVGELASENKIVMFRERKHANILERLISTSGKILILPLDQLRAFTNENPKQRAFLNTHEDLIRIFREIGMDPMAGMNTIQVFSQKRRASGIWHELYCPVLYKEYVVGYLQLIRSEAQKEPFSASAVAFVLQFSRLLSYSLQRNGYFKEAAVRQQFDKAELVDISGSGILFSYPLNGPSLELYADLDLKIHAGSREIPVKGRIMRLYRDSRLVYVGVQFLEIDEEDMQFLLSYIYGSDYDGRTPNPSPDGE